MNNSTEEQKKLNNDVKESFREHSRDINETLRNFIYFERKMNMNQVAELTGYSRQYLWGVMNRRMKASFSFARKICDVLQIKEIKTLFREDDIDYPNLHLSPTHPNANVSTKLDSGEIGAGQSPESSLNQPSDVDVERLEVNKNE